MGCFPKLEEVPDTVVDFVRRAVDLPEGTAPRAANRTAERQRTAVRQCTGLSYDKARARKIAEAVSKNRPADLINIALEKVVEAGPESPGFTTLDALREGGALMQLGGPLSGKHVLFQEFDGGATGPRRPRWKLPRSRWSTHGVGLLASP